MGDLVDGFDAAPRIRRLFGVVGEGKVVPSGFGSLVVLAWRPRRVATYCRVGVDGKCKFSHAHKHTLMYTDTYTY